MRYYSGIDLGARDCHVCTIDEDLRIVVNEKVRNELPRIVRLLEPYKETLQIVVESTFNWYWLIDGLQEAGYDVCLAHTLGLYMITGAKVKTDPRDAFGLAKLLKAGVIPKAYIYPKQTRPTRDLLRRRLRLVRLRATEYGNLRRLLLRQGILDATRADVRDPSEEDLEVWFKHPMIKMHAQQELDRIALYSRQIKNLETTILATVAASAPYDRLLGIAGIGKILALTILYEIGDMARFKDIDHFVSYCRLIPGVAQSSKSNRRGRGSKQGSHYLKWAFSQAAIHAVRCYPKIRQCYDRQVNRHRGRYRKLIATNIIAHKLAQAAFHVLAHGTVYQEKLMFGT